jgi:hypothetical protein
MMQPTWIRLACMSVAVLRLGVFSAAASDGTLAGRLTDNRGTAVADATILVFPAGGSRQLDAGDGGARLQSDARGAFSANLPEGRFVVAAVKRGYEISIAQVCTRTSRVLHMQMRPSDPKRGADAMDARVLDQDWLLRQQRADVLRDEGASISDAAYLTDKPTDADRDSRAANTERALLGPIDGDLAHSFAAENLLGMVDGAADSDDAARMTALTLHAPLNRQLAWSLDGMSGRSRIGLPDGAGRLTGASDRLAAGVDYRSLEGERTAALRGWFGTATAGTGRVSQRSLEGTGEMALGGGATHRLAVGLRAWGGEADLGDGTFLTLDGAASTAPEIEREVARGYNLYAGERLRLGDLTQMDYGLEYRSDSAAGEDRAVPRLGVSRVLAPGSQKEMTIRSDLLLDPGNPGGRLAIQAAPHEQVQVSASLAFLPANAFIDIEAAVPGRPAAWGLPAPGLNSAATREVDVQVAADLGPLEGSLSGTVGRAGQRSLPVIEEGPLALVSFGYERFYETRLGIGYQPWEARMEIGYRRVVSETRPDTSTPAGPPLDYRRLDLLLSKVLPSPRSILGAQLRALVEWQGLEYESLLAANGGSLLSGVTGRLSGGVGLTF